MVVGGVVPAHLAGVLEVVGDDLVGEVALREADRVRRDRLTAGGQRGDHGGRVDAAGEERAERHVGDRLAQHRVVDAGADGGDPLRLAALLGREAQVPPLRHGDAARVDPGVVARRQLLDAGKRGLRVGHPEEGEVVGEGARLQRRPADVRQQALQLGGEREDRRVAVGSGAGAAAGRGAAVGAAVVAAAGRGAAVGAAAEARAQVVERLDAEAVARDEEAVIDVVPDRQRVDAVQPVEHRRAVQREQPQQHLGVGAAVERVACAFQLGLQLAVVVDLAVVGDVPALPAHRLGACRRRVDDREPTMAEAAGGLAAGAGREEPQALAVGAAMRHDVGHPAQLALLGAADGAADPAHGG